MNTKKIIGTFAPHRDKIQDLRNFLSIAKEEYEYEKINLSDNDFENRLKRMCYFIEEKIYSTIEYYQYNEASITEIENAKGKCKDLTILLNNYKIELTKYGINQNEYLTFKKEIDDAFDFDLTKKTKKLLANYLEIKKEFEEILESINIEASIKTTKYKSNKDKEERPWFEIGLLFAKGEIQKQYKLTPSYPKTANKLKFTRPIHTLLIKATIANYQSNNKQKNIYSSKKYMTEIYNYCIENNIEICKEFNDKYIDLVNITTL